MMVTVMSRPLVSPLMVPPPAWMVPDLPSALYVYWISPSVDPLRWAWVSGVKVTRSWPLLPVSATVPLLTWPGLPAARIWADGLLVPLVPALLVAETVKV